MEDTPGELIWDRQARGRMPRGGLDANRIADAAVSLADAEGLEAVSMRRLATELGSGTMSLYRHVRGKDDVLDLMLDAVYRSVELPPGPSGDWRADLSALARQTRALLLRHGWVGWVLANRPPFGPHYLRSVEFALGVLAAEGVGPVAAMRMAAVPLVFVAGFAGTEAAEAEAVRRHGVSDDAKRAAAAPYMARFAGPGGYPHLAAWMERALAGEAREAPSDEDFEFGLGCVLDGVAAALAREARTGTVPPGPPPPR